MQVQFNTDNQIDGDAEMSRRVEADVRDRLARFENRITRVEIRLGGTNARKSEADKRRTMEARPAGTEPIAVTHEAESIDQAITGATSVRSSH